jgi:hypothetical protein
MQFRCRPSGHIRIWQTPQPTVVLCIPSLQAIKILRKLHIPLIHANIKKLLQTTCVASTYINLSRHGVLSNQAITHAHVEHKLIDITKAHHWHMECTVIQQDKLIIYRQNTNSIFHVHFARIHKIHNHFSVLTRRQNTIPSIVYKKRPIRHLRPPHLKINS